jgi:hypothetical protein
VTSDERKTLEALADDYQRSFDDGDLAYSATGKARLDAIRAALAEIDARNAPCAMPDCPHDATGCNRCLKAENEALLASLREARARAADLEARAIPARWVEQAAVSGEMVLSLHAPGGGWLETIRFHSGKTYGIPAFWTRREPDGVSESGCATLSAALRAAAKES